MGRRIWGSYPSDSADGEAYFFDDQCPHACLMVTSENRVNDDDQTNIKTLTHPHLKPLTTLLHVRTINCTPSVTTTHDLKSFATCTTLRFTPHPTSPRSRILSDHDGSRPIPWRVNDWHLRVEAASPVPSTREEQRLRRQV
jgi:hypothetical protein